MTTIHNLGFPRIGARRELKFALESYWKGESSRDDLNALGTALRQRHWADQTGIDLVPVGDFSFYDQILDMSFTLGNLPEEVQRHAVSMAALMLNRRIALFTSLPLNKLDALSLQRELTAIGELRNTGE